MVLRLRQLRSFLRVPTLRIAIAAAVFAGMMVGALVIIVDRHAAADRAISAAHRERAQAFASAHLDSLFWQEREAMSLQLNTRSRSDEVWVKMGLFEEAAAAIETEGPEAAQLAQAVAANRQLVILVTGSAGIRAKRNIHRTLVQLEAADPAVLRPLGQILDRNTQQSLRQERLASGAARSLFLLEIVCALLASVAGVLFALVAIRLIRRIDGQNAELDAQNAKLLDADRVKDEFIGTVSHELRTPITSIQGYLDLVLDDESEPITDDQRQFLGIVHRNAGRLLRLVNDLLFVAQVEAKELDIRLERIDLVEIARQAAEAARPQADKQDLRLTFDTALVRAPAAGDAARLAQAIDNLLSNAVKFTPAGGKVGVTVTEEAGHALITVTDTGMGMTEEELARLFERFFRTEAAQVKSIQGTGLGLTITRAIITAHGGAITVRSQPQAGTSFAIKLPLQPPPAEDERRRRETLALGNA